MKEIKVVSYNVHSTICMDGKADYRKSADVLKSLDPDVAGVQELGVYTKRVPDVDAPLEIARHTRMNYLFSRSLVTTEAGGNTASGLFPLTPWNSRCAFCCRLLKGQNPVRP